LCDREVVDILALEEKISKGFMHPHPCDEGPPINNKSRIQSWENNMSENMPSYGQKLDLI
jgi:hypothetical protein